VEFEGQLEQGWSGTISFQGGGGKGYVCSERKNEVSLEIWHRERRFRVKGESKPWDGEVV